MKDKPKPLYKVSCKKCGHAILTELGAFWENKGKLKCPECGHSDYYKPSEAKKSH
jgi:predicted nucleic-acid-binding Zn-ribbon protein